MNAANCGGGHPLFARGAPVASRAPPAVRRAAGDFEVL